MDYRANLDTALTYLEAGLKDRAVEFLCKIYNGIREQGIEEHRETFLRVLPLMIRVAMENNKHEEAIGLINEGLSIDEYHCDLLFLKAMYFWDEDKHDEMFVALITFLASLGVQRHIEREYQYVNDLAIEEIFSTLIPFAYERAAARVELAKSVNELAEKTNNAYLIKVRQLLMDIDRDKDIDKDDIK